MDTRCASTKISRSDDPSVDIMHVINILLLVVHTAHAFTHSLDGPWDFFTSDGKYHAQIVVPGAWEAQGIGDPTSRMHHQYIGGTIYQRTIHNMSWVGAGNRLFLVIEHVHRSVQVFVNGAFLGSHIGYMDVLQFDVTKYATAPSLDIALHVNSSRPPATDPLEGAMDVDTDGIWNGVGGWGGIYGHVYLDARPPFYIDTIREGPPHVQCHVIAGGDAICAINVTLSAEPRDAHGSYYIAAVVGDAKNTTLVPSAATSVVVEIVVPEAQLWTPETPHLYTASIELLDGSKRVVDAHNVTFGVREIVTKGYTFLLNGKPLFLRGYGDDSVYPSTMAPPATKALYLRKLRFAKSVGFNFVRHHSHVLPAAYFEAADEVGVLVSPELQCAYGQYYDAANAVGLALYRSTWRGYIKRLRNHPSIFDWAPVKILQNTFSDRAHCALHSYGPDPHSC